MNSSKQHNRLPILHFTIIAGVAIFPGDDPTQVLSNLQPHSISLTAVIGCGRFEKKEAELLQTLNDLEIETEEDKSTLFRGASLTTALLDLYMKSVCTGFLQVAISDMINRVVESKQACEVRRGMVEADRFTQGRTQDFLKGRWDEFFPM